MDEHAKTENLRRAVGFERDGRFFEAETLYRQLVGIQPPHAMSHYHYGCFKLLRGEFADAWPLFQGRLAAEFYQRKATMRLAQPWWQGEQLPDKTLLVHTDQGIGDAILGARFVPRAADRVGTLIFAVQKGLSRFFGKIDRRIEVVETGDSWPEFDVHIDLFSLAALFDAGPDTMPAVPYVAAEPALADEWRERLAGPGLAVGLVWQGNPEHPRDAERSMPLQALMPVLETPGVRFFGLQVGDGAEQAAGLPGGLDFTDLGADLKADGMVDTTAVMANLDLVIAVDTAAANLAGAMARPLWVPMPMVPDWRWVTLVETSPIRYGPAPWYPSARPFHQKVRYDWAPVIGEIAGELAEMARKRGQAGVSD